MRSTYDAIAAALVLLVVAACGGEAPAARPAHTTTIRAAAKPAQRWLKGQLHLHSARSADSATPPADVVRWYRRHGYDFIVFTDHNHVTVERGDERMLVIPGVELTRNLETCVPTPDPGDACLLHVNALFVSPSHAGPVDLPAAGTRRADVYAASIAQARAMDGVAQINHPNFQHGADADVLFELSRRGAAWVEIANEAIDSDNAGDGTHPSTEALWDAVLTRGGRLFGTATDDAHHYDDASTVRARGETAYVGNRGWVHVEAARDARAIRAALEAGRFYASNGVELTRVAVVDGALEIAIAQNAPPHVLRFIGPSGRVVSEVRGHRARQPLVERGYVRAVVLSPEGRRAWTQPVFR
ncbi:MAG: CehA/McbA family metallohydrolase [Deltaproteobacteria bacterium]|nr:CehA/McbA family metallohydrolase [Deltaproteobacteria bacterium]